MEPKQLEAKQGLQWIKTGYGLFIKAPLLWIVLLAICITVAVVLSAIPVIGETLLSLFIPVIMIGLMSGCYSLEKGGELKLAYLFIGFARHTSRLIALGGIALCGQYLIYGVMMMAGGEALVNLLKNEATVAPEIVQSIVADSGASPLIGFALFSLLMMSMQFAPMLVFFRNVPPIQALKLSLFAFTRNMGAMFVYGTAFMFLAFLASIPMMLGWLIVLPMMFTSLYASFCDIFPHQPVGVPDNGQDEVLHE
jgi:hypothetical protein